MAFCRCSARFWLLLVVASAIPIAYIISLELSAPPTHVFRYRSAGFLRECAKWDPLNRRFLVSFLDGGLAQLPVPDDLPDGVVLPEILVVKDPDVAGNASLGIAVDPPRNRVLVVNADLLGQKYSALAAYDLSTWRRLFLTRLSGPDDGKAFADDVAVDAEGNAYVTDATASKIWKVGEDGELLSIIRSPLFTVKEWYKNLVALNGIVYHPDGFLLVIHTLSGNLYKVDVSNGNHQVKLVQVAGDSLAFGDGLELVSPTRIVVAASSPSATLVESRDGWETAEVVGTFKGPMHRLATAATVKDGRVYVSHMFGLGFPKEHVLVEAVFSA